MLVSGTCGHRPHKARRAALSLAAMLCVVATGSTGVHTETKGNRRLIVVYTGDTAVFLSGCG